MAASFTEETWTGGFYELALEYEHASREILEAALKAMWNFPDLRGCYLRPDESPSRQTRVAPDLAALESNGQLYGAARLPGGAEVACGAFLVQEEDDNAWLGFYVPLGALAKVFNVGAYPFDNDPASQAWREPLEDWLARIGQAVFTNAPFSLGLVGFEVSGTTSARQLALSEVPAKRSIGYLHATAKKLNWYPTNQWQPSCLAS